MFIARSAKVPADERVCLTPKITPVAGVGVTPGGIGRPA
jgi:hypothetical protein